jgi:hypothetical protein
MMGAWMKWSLGLSSRLLSPDTIPSCVPRPRSMGDRN